jgi:hypothetical protein
MNKKTASNTPPKNDGKKSAKTPTPTTVVATATTAEQLRDTPAGVVFRRSLAAGWTVSWCSGDAINVDGLLLLQWSDSISN